jgi:hypothetical protein
VAAWEARSSNLEIEKNLSIYLRMEGIQENLCRVGRSRDLPGAHWLLAGSPATEEYIDSLMFP